MGIYFFLSYARGDDDSHVHQFYRDLCGEVRAYAGLSPSEQVGFLDATNLEVGAEWAKRLLGALVECRTFVALLSPRYVVSAPCGREWTVFAERLQRYEAEAGLASSALVPVRWLVPRRTPEVVERLQYDNDHLPPAYREVGLRQLMRLQRHRDSYLELVTHLARHIVDTADLHPIPQGATDRSFSDIPNAFAPMPDLAQSSPSPPHEVRFLVAAPTVAELAAPGLAEASRQGTWYGMRSLDWAPYRPETVEPLAERARAVAHERDFASSVGDVVGALPRTDNQLVVLLVDVWAARLASYRQALTQLSTRDESMAAVMVPSNHSDQQTQEQWPSLLQLVRSIFLRRAVNGDSAAFRAGILSPRAFDADLGVVLETAKNRTFTTGLARRPMPEDPHPRPVLDGP